MRASVAYVDSWLVELERIAAGSDLATALVTVASVAGRELPIDEDETRAAGRRALLVLASGGDPSRGLDLQGPAVERLADELDAPDRRSALSVGLVRLRDDAIGLPHVSEAVKALIDAPETAWRAYAAAVLAEQLAD
jgi:hypothetical protein